MPGRTKQRRSLKYIRLAAYLASRPANMTSIELTLGEIEGLVGAALPPSSRWPSWWRNDGRRMHARAWLTAGWLVTEMAAQDAVVRFERGKV
ncbi:MAG: hypothetical protein GEU78_07130 [Actinobacteria bacterium]|nr:hypothetical protein [Actinomycetota bacterium]